MLELDKGDWTLIEAVRRQARDLGDRPFLTFLDPAGGDPRVLSFAGFDTESDTVARALMALGVEPGDRVMMLGYNSAEFMTAMIGTNKAGAVFVPINTELKGAFLAHQLVNSEPTVVIVDDELLGAFDSVDRGGASVRATVVVGQRPEALPGRLAGSNAMSFDEFVAHADPFTELPPPPVPSDISTIMYTSGTTGPSKGVLMPQAHCLMFGMGTVRAVDLSPDDHYFICMPLFHANGLLMQVYGCLMAGTPATVVRRFSPNTWLNDVIACGATVTNALGVMPEFIFRTAPTERDRDHDLRLVMAVPISAEWGAAFEERFGLRLFQGFGMTECNIPVYSDPADPLIPGCAGRVLDDWFDVRVVDPDTDEPLEPDEVGEIVVRPLEASCFMAGYFRMPEKTVEAWRNLWFHTGDAGRFDPQGRLHFVDRIKDCIRRRGENISSFEVEQVINNHPAVAESAVVGVKVAGAGGEEEVKACVVLHPEAELTPEELLEHCQAAMPRYAVPRFVEWVTELDKTQTGKIRKPELREAGVTPTTWDRESVGYVVPR